jgi:hypothetical protein
VKPNSEAVPKEVLLQSNSPEYRQLREWVAQNQKGWFQSLATNPSQGVFVYWGDLHLQFVDDLVFVFTKNGQFQKEIREQDYTFLTKAAGI